MSIAATLGELKTAEQPLTKLAEEKVHARASILVARLVKKVAMELSLLEEQRIKLVKELGEEKEGSFLVPEGRVPEFQAKFLEMLGVSVTLDCEPLTESIFEGVSVSARDLLLLGPLSTDS